MTIDGKNIRQEYGCTLIWEGSTSVQHNLSAILKYPNRTAVQFRNWAEEDGIRPDLSEFLTEPKKVQLQFLMEADTLSQFWTLYRKLIADITSPKPHTFEFDGIGTFTYRYDVNSAYQHPKPFNAGKNLSIFMFDFLEESPVFGSASTPLNTGSAPTGQYSINGYDLGSFGMHMEDGTDELLKYPSMKSPFTDGKKVDFTTVRMAHKEANLSLWQLAKSKEEFLHNREAFWNQFSRPGTTELYFNDINGTTDIYYQKCSSYTLENWGDRCAARFTISIVVPVYQWADGGGTTIFITLKDMGTGKILADEFGRKIVFNKR